MIQRILLAYDGSAHARRAAAVAQEIAAKFNAHVKVVYAFNPISRLIGNPGLEEAIQRETAQGNQIAGEIVAQLQAAGIEAEPDVLEGAPADAILRAAEADKSDLIVIGSRGLGNAAAIFLGSVSHKVIHAATCPVLVVK